MSERSASNLPMPPKGYEIFPSGYSEWQSLTYCSDLAVVLTDTQNPNQWSFENLQELIGYPMWGTRRCFLVFPEWSLDSLEPFGLVSTLDRIGEIVGCSVTLIMYGVKPSKSDIRRHPAEQEVVLNRNDDPGQPRVEVHLVTKEYFRGEPDSGWETLYVSDMDVFNPDGVYNDDIFSLLQGGLFHVEEGTDFNCIAVFTTPTESSDGRPHMEKYPVHNIRLIQ